MNQRSEHLRGQIHLGPATSARMGPRKVDRARPISSSDSFVSDSSDEVRGISGRPGAVLGECADSKVLGIPFDDQRSCPVDGERRGAWHAQERADRLGRCSRRTRRRVIGGRSPSSTFLSNGRCSRLGTRPRGYRRGNAYPVRPAPRSPDTTWFTNKEARDGGRRRERGCTRIEAIALARQVVADLEDAMRIAGRRRAGFRMTMERKTTRANAVAAVDRLHRFRPGMRSRTSARTWRGLGGDARDPKRPRRVLGRHRTASRLVCRTARRDDSSAVRPDRPLRATYAKHADLLRNCPPSSRRRSRSRCQSGALLNWYAAK